MSQTPIPLTPALQQRILRAIRNNHFDLTDFAEFCKPTGAKLRVNPNALSAAERDRLTQQRIPYLTSSGRLNLTKSAKLSLLKACQVGILDPAAIPELVAAQQAHKRDYSRLSLDQLRVLAKLGRLHWAGL